MRTHIHFGGNSGDTGDRPVNTGDAVFPLAVLIVGTLGTSQAIRLTRRLVPTVPIDVLSSGDAFRPNKDGYVPTVPTVPSENHERPEVMSAFLAKWANIQPQRHSEGPPTPALTAIQAYFLATSPGSGEPAHEAGASEGPEHERALPWAEWKAAALNRLFKEQGLTWQPGRITAATLRHGEAGRTRVDSAASNERPMSRAEATE